MFIVPPLEHFWVCIQYISLFIYLFITIQPMKNVFYYWSDKTKEDKKIIDLLHREVKLDKFL